MFIANVLKNKIKAINCHKRVSLIHDRIAGKIIGVINSLYHIFLIILNFKSI